MTLSPPLTGIRSAAAGMPARLRTGYGIRVFTGEHSLTVLLILAVYLGFVVRLYHVLSGHGFPLNDGGMFYSMVQDVRHSHFALPEYVSYNGGDIPFAYSPLGFCLAAVLADVLGVSVIDSLRFLPLIASTAAIPAFYLLARALLPNRSMVVLATFLFAFTPRAFNWEIGGGGLTRSLGFFFAILAIYHLYRLTREPGLPRALVATVLVALTAASHMEMAMFIAWTYALILCVYGRSWRHLAYAAVIALGALALTAPWWGLVLSRHGIEPFIAAGRTGSQSLIAPARFFFLDYTDEPFLPVLAALGIIGFLAGLARRDYFLPAWLFVIFILDPRKAPTYATLPLAMLAAQAVLTVLRPQFQPPDPGKVSLSKAGGSTEAEAWKQSDSQPNPAKAGVARMLPGIVVAYCALAALAAGVVQISPLRALPPAEAQAMYWVAGNTPADSRFLVISGRTIGPWIDDSSEWFPALGDRVSLATVQGTEWLSGDRGMVQSVKRYDKLQLCADLDAACLTSWAEETHQAYTHVYIEKAPAETRATDHGRLLKRDCCAALRQSLASSSAYHLIYDGEQSQVYELLQVTVKNADQ